jgi:hypothetical protein
MAKASATYDGLQHCHEGRLEPSCCNGLSLYWKERGISPMTLLGLSLAGGEDIFMYVFNAFFI